MLVVALHRAMPNQWSGAAVRRWAQCLGAALTNTTSAAHTIMYCTHKHKLYTNTTHAAAHAHMRVCTCLCMVCSPASLSCFVQEYIPGTAEYNAAKDHAK